MNFSEDKTIQRTYILGYPVDIINNNQAFSIAQEALENKNCLHVVTLNPEMIVRAQRDPELSTSILNSNLNIPDGVGILLALFLKGIKLKNTTPGIELSEKCIEFCANNNLSVAFFGAKEEVLTSMLDNFKKKYPDLKIAFLQNGYFEPEQIDEITDNMAKTQPGLVLIALGVPRQETWINKYKHLFPQSVLIGVGGSFDVWSGKVKRAPLIFRKLKLEWFYRLITDPSRAKRIFTALPYFVFQLFTYKNKQGLTSSI